MTTEIKSAWVKEGDKFAGGVLTQQGAAEVNGHRTRVLNGEISVTKKVMKAYYNKPGISLEQAAKAQKALDVTPW